MRYTGLPFVTVLSKTQNKHFALNSQITDTYTCIVGSVYDFLNNQYQTKK